jgi:hypothetical protein
MPLAPLCTQAKKAELSTLRFGAIFTCLFYVLTLRAYGVLALRAIKHSNC